MACIASTFTGSVAALKASRSRCASRRSTLAFFGGIRFLAECSFPPDTPRLASAVGAAAADASAFLFFQAKAVSKVIKADIYPDCRQADGGDERQHRKAREDLRA